jgi:hypothetical protein
MVTSGGAGRHAAPPHQRVHGPFLAGRDADAVIRASTGLLPQAVRAMAAAAATAITAIAGLPTRFLPKGGCAFPASNDNVALTRLRPPCGQQGLGGPRPLIRSVGKRKLNKRGTNRRPLDVI